MYQESLEAERAVDNGVTSYIAEQQALLGQMERGVREAEERVRLQQAMLPESIVRPAMRAHEAAMRRQQHAEERAQEVFNASFSSTGSMIGSAFGLGSHAHWMMCSTASYFDDLPGGRIEFSSGPFREESHGSHADAKAHALLLEHVGHEEYVNFMRRGWIRFEGRWEWYVFLDGTVWCVDGEEARKLCIQTITTCPTMDKVATLKLLIEHDEGDVFREANVIGTVGKEVFLKNVLNVK